MLAFRNRRLNRGEDQTPLSSLCTLEILISSYALFPLICERLFFVKGLPCCQKIFVIEIINVDRIN